MRVECNCCGEGRIGDLGHIWAFLFIARSRRYCTHSRLATLRSRADLYSFSFAEPARSLVPDRNRLSSKLWSPESACCERDKGDFFHWPSNFVIRHYSIRNRAWSKLSFCVSIDTRTCSTMLIRFFHWNGGHSYAVL